MTSAANTETSEATLVPPAGPDDWAADAESRVLAEALALALTLGWTRAMTKAAGAAAGFSLGETELLLPAVRATSPRCTPALATRPRWRPWPRRTPNR